MTMMNLALIGGVVIFPSIRILLLFILVTTVLYIYGSRRSMGLAVNRLNTKRIFRARGDKEIDALVGPIYSHYLYMTDFVTNPFSVPEYVNQNLSKIKWIDRIMDALSAANKGLYAASIGSILLFVKLFNPLFAYAFVYSFLALMVSFASSVFLFIWVEGLRALAPPVWRVEDVWAVTGSKKSVDTELSNQGDQLSEGQ